jgi:hypothetical protein
MGPKEAKSSRRVNERYARPLAIEPNYFHATNAVTYRTAPRPFEKNEVAKSRGYTGGENEIN